MERRAVMKLSDVIKDYRESHGLSARELSKRSGVSHSYLIAMEKGEAKSPTIEILDKLAKTMAVSTDSLIRVITEETYEPEKRVSKGVKIPVLGRVKAGVPVDAVQEIIDYEEITTEMAKTGEFFALQIRGDSMYPEMAEGDVVIVKKQNDIVSGQVAILLVNGNEATVKRIKKFDGGIMVIPFNQKYQPWTYTAEEIE